MNERLVMTLVQVGGLAVETLADYLRQPPADATAAASQDRACVALMQQQQRIADALRTRLGVPETAAGGLAEPAAARLDAGGTGELDVDQAIAFLQLVEGWSTRGYVPQYRSGKTIGRSGVTIGIGVDLGCRTARDLQRLDVPAALLDRLRPYLGQQGEAALKVLNRRPLRLSADDALLLSEAVAGDIIRRVALRYDAAGPACRFAKLPPAAQTVIASVAYQYGEALAGACPRFWRLAVDQDWQGMVAELGAFGDEYATRRRQEADLLRPLLPATPAGNAAG